MNRGAKYISASAMHFRERPGLKMPAAVVLVLAFFWHYCASGEVIDSVSAFIDDDVITRGELETAYELTKKLQKDITVEEVLNTMVNRVLLLREAKNAKIEAPSEDEILREYVDFKVGAFIKVTERDVRDFYEKNKNAFGGADLDSQKDNIEKLLGEKELNRRLESHIKELRAKAHIKIFLK